MKTQIVFALCVGMLIVSGCASKQIVRNEVLPMEIKETQNVSVVRVRNYMDENHLVVSGAVKRDYFFRTTAYGHVDILFLDKEDNIIKESNVRYLPARLSTNWPSSLFKETFNEVPKDAKQIVVSYHNQYFFEENHHVH